MTYFALPHVGCPRLLILHFALLIAIYELSVDRKAILKWVLGKNDVKKYIGLRWISTRFKYNGCIRNEAFLEHLNNCQLLIMEEFIELPLLSDIHSSPKTVKTQNYDVLATWGK
jgi:hypothetical protein